MLICMALYEAVMLLGLYSVYENKNRRRLEKGKWCGVKIYKTQVEWVRDTTYRTQ